MPSVLQMGVPGLPRKNMQPKLAHHWRVTFIGWGRLIVGYDEDAIPCQAKDVQRPNTSFDTTEDARFNSITHVYGRGKIGTVSLTVVDDINGLVSTAIGAQINTQQRITGSALDATYLTSAPTGSDMKFDMLVEMLAGDGEVVERWNCQSCGISSWDPDNLGYDGGATIVTHRLTCTVDALDIEIVGGGYGPAVASLT